MDYKEALIAAKNGKAVLFVGAGFSCMAKCLNQSNLPLNQKTLPTGRKLAQMLCDYSGAQETDDLKKATSRFLKKKNKQELIDLLKDIFTVKEVTEDHKEIVKVNWKSIYTTNYDTVIETAGVSVGKKYTPLNLSRSPRKENLQKSIVHINGFIDELNDDSLENTFKLTNTSYLTAQFRQSAWSEVFIRDIQSAHAVFFVGYSMYDIDIQEIIYADSRLKEKIFFIEREDLTEDEKEDSDLNDFGEILSIGISNFANDLKNVDPLSLSSNTELVITSFDELFSNTSQDVKMRDSFLFDLLLKGEVQEGVLFNQILAGKRDDYVICRDAEEQIIQDIIKNENIVIHSDLANGKSILVKTLCIKLLGNGFRVFLLRDESYDCFDEIDQIISFVDKPIIIFENYTRKLNLVGHANIKRKTNTKLILTARTSEHERYEEELFFSRRLIDPQNTQDINVNKLTQCDIEKFSNLLDIYGLWGNKITDSNFKKKRYIQSKCNSEIHGILLDVLDSPQLKDRLAPLFSELAQSAPIMKALVSAFALSIINIDSPSFHMIAALTDDSSIFRPSFRKNNTAKQFLNTSRDTIIPKSSAMAEYVFKNFPSPDLLIKTLVDICKNARKKADGNKMYLDIYRDLASFRYAEKLLPTQRKRDSLVLFYEGLRTIDVERRNPHFWLQYAIARLSFPEEENLTYAKQHLDTGLSLASRKTGYWKTDLETQYARYYLEHCTRFVDDVKGAFEEFMKADSILQAITRAERYKREAYRPVKLYLNFFNKFKDALGEEEVQKINKASLQLIININKLPDRTKDDPTVKSSLNGLENICDSIKRRIQANALAHQRPHHGRTD